jgi:GT2 family glycosyltransferase
VLGAAFNIRNLPSRKVGMLKNSALADWLGLYSTMPGGVALSGWQTVAGEFATTRFVDWIPSTAVVFTREVFNTHAFDEVFESYSYLEDLDLSYTIGRKGRLAVVSDAGFSHFPSKGGRVSSRIFGRYEVRNRLYFVRKHQLSITRCYCGIVLRLAMSIGSGLAHLDLTLLNRALGNLEELFRPGTSNGRKVTAESCQI